MWQAQQPLSRIHRHTHATVYFSTDRSGRFDPPVEEAGWGPGTCRRIPGEPSPRCSAGSRPSRRGCSTSGVLASAYLPSDVRLADFTHPQVLGRYGLTGAVSAGTDAVYPVTQAWVARLALDTPEVVTNLAVLDSVPIGEALARVVARFATAWFHWCFFAQPVRPERLIAADSPSWARKT